MDELEKRFSLLGVEYAPGQEVNLQAKALDLQGPALAGRKVDFSHGDVDAFPPPPASKEAFLQGFAEGAAQAYTEYSGKKAIREQLAADLAAFMGAPVDGDKGLILTAGTQGALFLAVNSLLPYGGDIAIVTPDYFANHKLAAFLGATIHAVPLQYMDDENRAGLDLQRLEEVFAAGVQVFLFSNPNNPTGAVYSAAEVQAIGKLAKKYKVAVIVDELYSRQIYEGRTFTHLCAQAERPDTLVTIIGPSKTESMSGFRLGCAFGTPAIIERMEKLQAIMTLRAAGYCQPLFRVWFHEGPDFIPQRVAAHQEIRDALLDLFRKEEGVTVRSTNAGSYLFPTLPELTVPIADFTSIVKELAQVIVTPGTEFGPEWTHSIRLNFSQDKEAAIAAVKRLLVIMNRYRK